MKPSPSIGSLIAVPALITLAVTVLRLILELNEAPAWLASREAGGKQALLGISWLPLLFGPLFAWRLRESFYGTWPLLKRLLKTLLIYGWVTRVPVVIITLLAIHFGWDTHFNKFGNKAGEATLLKNVGGTLVAQLIFWAVIWTPIVGGLAGILFHLLTRRPATASDQGSASS